MSISTHAQINLCAVGFLVLTGATGSLQVVCIVAEHWNGWEYVRGQLDEVWIRVLGVAVGFNDAHSGKRRGGCCGSS